MISYKSLEFIGYSDYKVGDDGSVWSRGRQGSNTGEGGWSCLKPGRIHGKGHAYVMLRRRGEKSQKQFLVHRLVLFAFVGPCPKGMECRHFPDRDPTNNKLENLSWGTRKQNANDRNYHNTDNKGERNGSAKLTWGNVRKIRKKR